MKSNEKHIIEKLESMSLEDARVAIATGIVGDVGSPNHAFAISWLSVKEAASRDAKEAETLSIARKALRNSKWANIIAIAAIVFSVITAIIIALIEIKL
jgi:hypothetical protein